MFQSKKYIQLAIQDMLTRAVKLHLPLIAYDIPAILVKASQTNTISVTTTCSTLTHHMRAKILYTQPKTP